MTGRNWRRGLGRTVRRAAVLALVAGLVLGSLLVGPTPAAASAVPAPRGIWLGAAELLALPTSGEAWERVRAAAGSAAGEALVCDQDSDHDVTTLAMALVAARTGDAALGGRAATAIGAAIGTQDDCGENRTLALGRNLVAYVVAADLVNLTATDPVLDVRFRAWLSAVRTWVDDDGRTLIATHDRRPNNWGTMAGAARVAADVYLGDLVDLQLAWRTFRGYVGERDAHAGFDFGHDLSWQCDPAAPVPVNPAGCTRDGHRLDGVPADDMRRNGSFAWPPPNTTSYVQEGMQGLLVQAELLRRAGFPATEAGGRAVLRVSEWLHAVDSSFGGWWYEGDDAWQPHLVNFLYGTSFPAGPARSGKNMGFTDWTHAGRSVAPASVAAPVPRAAPPTSGPVDDASGRFVDAVYRDFLGRAPDAAGRAYWTTMLAGGLGRRELTGQVSRSAEWLGHTIEGMYQLAFGRSVDGAGLDHWRGRLAGGTPVVTLAALLVGSSEGYALGGGTPEGFVSRVYERLLGRAPDAAGLAHWSAAVRDGGDTQTIAASLYQSLEHRTARVVGLYDALLGRAPDPAGLAFWAGELLHVDDLRLASLLAESEEYFARAQR